MSEKKYVPATPDSSVAKKWVNHLNSQVRKGGDIGVYSGNKNKEIIVPTSINNGQGNLARGFFSFYVDGNTLYVYDSLTGWGTGMRYCGYGIVGDQSIPVPEQSFDISKIYEPTEIINSVFPYIYVVYINFYTDDGFRVRARLQTFCNDGSDPLHSGLELKLARNFRLGRIGYDGNEVKIVYDINPNPVVLA